MRSDPAELGRLSARYRFLPAALEKVLRLGELLAEFGRGPLLREALLLKGGTALNLRDRAPVRLSVDPDFNYVRAEQREAMLADRPAIESAIARIAGAGAYQVQLSAEEHAGRKVFLSYRNAAGVRDRIEVDVNYLHRVALAEPLTRAQLPPLQPVEVLLPHLRHLGRDHHAAVPLPGVPPVVVAWYSSAG